MILQSVIVFGDKSMRPLKTGSATGRKTGDHFCLNRARPCVLLTVVAVTGLREQKLAYLS